MKQQHVPLYDALEQFKGKQPTSFHVPGHKNGHIFPHEAREVYQSILQIDMTELTGLDDLHAPTGVIADAEKLAADFFQTEKTFFLVGGSTVGNLAMILAVCKQDDTVIVQRNCHKSIMNGLELSGAKPVFIAPQYDENVRRFTQPSLSVLQKALNQYPHAKAVILTYPDYFGKAYDLRQFIEQIHAFDIPVLVDEAHGVHFSLGENFPPSALHQGADVVVQSAHKMAPAMTMGSYLHYNSRRISKERIAHYLQMLQSSSPSYPLLASLDLARYYLATMQQETMAEVLASAQEVKHIFAQSPYWELIASDDPLKITLHVKAGIVAKEVANLLEKQQIYPELVTENQILLIHGLAPFKELANVRKALKTVNDQLKNQRKHDTIDVEYDKTALIQELQLSYEVMNRSAVTCIPLSDAAGYIAAEAMIPYPPGIAFILKGERITKAQIKKIQQMKERGIRIQQRHTNSIYVFAEIEEGEE